MEQGENILLNNELFGVALVEHMNDIRHHEGSLEFICEDGVFSTHPQPFKLFTKILPMDYESEDHYTLICQNVQKLVAKKAVQFLFTGYVACKDRDEKKSIINLLKDLTFLGHFEDETCVVDLYSSDHSIIKNEKECLIKYENDDVKMKSISEDHNFDSIEDNPERIEQSTNSANEDSDENSVKNNNKSSIKPKKRNNLGSRISLKLRLKQYPDLIEFEGNTVCKVCKVLLDWTKRCRVNDHMKSQKHLNRASKQKVDEYILTHADKIKLENQIRNSDNSTPPLEDNERCPVPVQEKLGQRLKDYPWLEKIPGLQEVQCSFCRCAVGWHRKSHIRDHSKSKKHLKALQEIGDKNPDLINKRLGSADLENEHVSGDRTIYRILLKQGTPSIQKLWSAALLTNSTSIQTQVSICFVCLKLFVTNADLIKHSSTQHRGLPNKLLHSAVYKKESKAFYCGGCNKYTEAKKSILSFLVHNLICRKIFYTSSNPIQCLACPLRFTEYKVFRDHLETIHSDLLPERMMCSDCPQTFLTNDELKKHVNQVHSDQYFSCTECPASFRIRKSLKDHVVKHHIGVKNFSCDKCGKEFYGKNNLRMHMRIHVAPDQRPHGCNICSLRFIDRKHLSNHQATHTNERPHFCHLCDARFKVRDWLSSHYIKHHNVSIKEVEAKYKQNENPGNQIIPLHSRSRNRAKFGGKNETPIFGATAQQGQGVTVNHQGVSASHQGVSASHQGVSTNHQGVSTNHQGVSASHQGLSANHQGVSANHQGVSASASHQGVSTNHQGVSTNHQGVSTNHQGVSASHQGVSANHQGVSTNHQGVSTSHQVVSTNHQVVSTNNQGVSIDHQDVSTNHQGVSIDHQDVSTNNQGVSIDHQDVSTNHQGVSASHQGVSAIHQRVSTNHQGVSTNLQGVSTNHQGVSNNHLRGSKGPSMLTRINIDF